MTLSSDTKAVEEHEDLNLVRTGQSHHSMNTTAPNHYSYTVGTTTAAATDDGATGGTITDDDVGGNDDDAYSTGVAANGLVGNSGSGSSTSDYSGLRGSPQGDGDTEQDMSNLVDVVENAIENAEEAEVKKEESMLSGAVKGMGGSIRSGLASLFGSNANAAEVEEIAVEVEKELEDDVDKEMEAEGTYIKTGAIYELDNRAEIEDASGIPISQIETDVKEHEQEVLDDVRLQVDEKAHEIQDKLSFKTAMIEKEIMEKRLSKQLGYQVKLQVVNDRVEGVQQALANAPRYPANPYNNVPNAPNGGGQYQQQTPQRQYYQPQGPNSITPPNQQIYNQQLPPPLPYQQSSPGGGQGQLQYTPQNINPKYQYQNTPPPPNTPSQPNP